jgi:AcrR family transcriptional regulator
LSRPDVRDERIPQIVDAAAAVFARDGIDGANMSEIAEAAGVSKATIYHYFASKEDVIAALVKRVFSLDRTAVDQLQNGDGPVRERLLTYAAKLAALFHENRDLFLVTGEIQARAARVPSLKSLAAGFYREYLAALEAAIEQGKRRKEVDPETNVQAKALGYISIIEGSMIVGHHLDLDLRESMIASVSTYIDGFFSAQDK